MHTLLCYIRLRRTDSEKVISTCIPTYAPLFRAFTSLNSYYNRYGYNSGYGHNGNAYALATRSMTNRASRRHTNAHTNTQSTSTSRLDRDLEILDDGTTIGKGGGFETTIMSVNTPMSSTFPGSSVGETSVGKARDSDSEELIKRSAAQVQGLAVPEAVHHHEEPPGTGLSMGGTSAEEDLLQIHTFTEFKIERHHV